MATNDDKRSGNFGGDMGGEISLKRQLVEATDSVRKKFNSLKNKNVGDQLMLEKIYEPITTPLKVISSATEVKLHNQVPTQTQKSTQSRASVRASTSTFKGSSEASDEDGDNNSTQTYFETPPRSSLMSTPVSESSFSGAKEQCDEIKKHLDNVKSGDPKYDTVYGVRLDPHTGKPQMGNSEVRFSSGTITLWYGNKKLGTYPGSTKLYDLIFMKYPSILRSSDSSMYDEEYNIYGEILKKTKAPYKNYDAKQGLKISKWKKFYKIIEPLTSPTVMTRSMKRGTGLVHIPTQKIYNNLPVDYVYWNKPIELVDRLRLLWSSKMAGNNNLDNHIISIIEELREEGIIY